VRFLDVGASETLKRRNVVLIFLVLFVLYLIAAILNLHGGDNSHIVFVGIFFALGSILFYVFNFELQAVARLKHVIDNGQKYPCRLIDVRFAQIEHSAIQTRFQLTVRRGEEGATEKFFALPAGEDAEALVNLVAAASEIGKLEESLEIETYLQGDKISPQVCVINGAHLSIAAIKQDLKIRAAHD